MSCIVQHPRWPVLVDVDGGVVGVANRTALTAAAGAGRGALMVVIADVYAARIVAIVVVIFALGRRSR